MLPPEDKEWDEFDYEKLMRESDARTDKYSELLDKYMDHPDRDRIISWELGWTWMEEVMDDAGVNSMTDIPVPEKIGFPNDAWQDIVRRKHGLVLFTGITGAGKSTTIASLIDRINENRACRTKPGRNRMVTTTKDLMVSKCRIQSPTSCLIRQPRASIGCVMTMEISVIHCRCGRLTGAFLYGESARNWAWGKWGMRISPTSSANIKRLAPNWPEHWTAWLTDATSAKAPSS